MFSFRNIRPLLVSYSVLARMPTYPSTATAYPYVYSCSTDSFFFDISLLCKCNKISDCASKFDFQEGSHLFVFTCLRLLLLRFLCVFNRFLSSCSIRPLSFDRFETEKENDNDDTTVFAHAVGIETIVPSIEMKVGSIMRAPLHWRKKTNDILSCFVFFLSVSL